MLSETGVTNYTYDAMGRMMERILPDSTTTKYEVNPLGRLTSLTHSRDGDVLDQFNYTYDPVGNITQIEKHRAGMEADSDMFQYTYDPLGRLVAAVRGDDIKRYRYDELGNRVKEWKGQKYDAVEWTQHNYNARNQLIRTQESDAVKEYRYDGRGNLTNITENGQLRAKYEFDATNMMVGAFTEGKGRAEYAYNGFRNRVKKLESLQNPGAVQEMQPDPIREIRYVLDMTLPYDNLLMTQGSQNQSFVWGNGLLAASGDDKFYYLQDHLGSPIRLVGEEDTDAPLAYDEFGVPLVGSSTSMNNPFGFTGYQFDDVSGLYYAQARYYEPRMGRFGAEDTIGSGVNWYVYCGGNSIRFIDPSGHYYIIKNREPTNLKEDGLKLGNFTGTYSIVQDSGFSPIIEGATSFIPIGGSLVSDYLTNPGGGDIIGGTSPNRDYTENLLEDGVKTVIDKKFITPKLGKGISNLFGGLDALYNLSVRSEIVDYDRTLFGLMDIRGLSSEFNSLDKLNAQISQLDYTITNNPNYFSGPVSFAGSRFLSDYELYGMSEENRKKKLMKEAGIPMYARMEMDRYYSDFIDQYLAYLQLLNDYNKRIDMYRNIC